MDLPSLSASIESLEPKLLWQAFAELTSVPRPSKQEEQIRAHLRESCASAGLPCREDAAGNLVIEVPASPGCENAAITVLQGHVDMVCEKNRDTEHDFDREPIHAVVDKDVESGERIVRAKGTTLGADNGIGVAMGLAVARSPDVNHGPLELLLTVDEEAGMTGAQALAPDFVKGRRMINLDSEEDDAVYIGCAGGVDVNLRWGLAASESESDAEMVKLSVSGLRGGHSGGDIHENRGNAIKLLVSTLTRAGIDGVQIGALMGGSKRNAIPREASVIVSGAAGLKDRLARAAEETRTQAAQEQGEPKLAINVEASASAGAGAILSVDDTQRVLRALSAVPSGVLGMHPHLEGLVQTSNNLSTVSWNSDESGSVWVEVGLLVRSSSEWWKRATVDQLFAIGRLAGAEVSTANGYPGWDPNVDSPLLATCRRIYEELFSEPPQVRAIHAGLECGLIGERMPGMDMVSIGPTIRGAHSPDERVYVDSVAKSWRFLTAILEKLARE